MTPTSQIRRLRLLELIKEVGSQVAVADAIGKNKNQVHQWLLPEDDDAARNMGHKSARQIETAFKKSPGWMDSIPEGFSEVAESSPTYDVRHSRLSRLSPATIRTSHEMLRWRFDYEGQRYDLETMPELFALAYQAAVSGEDSDKAALKAAVDQALLQGRENETIRRDVESAGSSGPNTAKRGSSGA